MPHSRPETRAAIEERALETFLEEGYDATTLDGIAAGLGLTRQAVLYHFKSKEAVLRAVMTPALVAIEDAQAALPANEHPNKQDQRRVIEAMLKVFMEHRGRIALMIRFTNHYSTADIGNTLQRLNRRTAELLAGPRFEEDPALRVCVAATLAALSGVMGARVPAPLDSPVAQAALVDGLLALLRSGR